MDFSNRALIRLLSKLQEHAVYTYVNLCFLTKEEDDI